MQITFRQDELAFVFDKNTKVKSITPRGECEFTVVFESYSEGVKPFVHETTYGDKVDIPVITETAESQENNQSCEAECPTVDDVVEFIRSLENYTYDNALVQEHFLGCILDSRVNANLYHKLKDIINRAKNTIQKEEIGKWKEKGYRSLSKTRRAKQFTFIRPKSVPIKTIPSKNETQFEDEVEDIKHETFD